MADARNSISMEEMFELLAKWDDVDAAINRIVTAQPAQMTAAAERLQDARIVMRGKLQQLLVPGKGPSHG